LAITRCELAGDTAISLQLPKDTVLAETPTVATFWDADSAVEVAVASDGTGGYTATCPQVRRERVLKLTRSKVDTARCPQVRTLGILPPVE